MTAEIKDPIKRPPTIDGPAGKAWEIDLSKVADRRAGVALWVVEAPWAHPVWHSYVLSVAHLRDDGGLFSVAETTRIYLPGATHEIMLEALDPKAEREPGLTDPLAIRRLTPKNFAAQFIATGDTVQSDAIARGRARAAVERIINGQLSPDTDHRAAWVALFGDNMVRK